MSPFGWWINKNGYLLSKNSKLTSFLWWFFNSRDLLYVSKAEKMTLLSQEMIIQE